MKASRRASNGRSPLVNQQRQITSFFSKKTASSPTTTPTPSRLKLTKQSPSPNTDCNHNHIRRPSPGPITPPLQSKPKKPLLVIGPSPSSSPSIPDSSGKSYGPEVVGRRIRVFWPLDRCWYEGCVKHFDEVSGKHLVVYDDAEEELLNLPGEKIEWAVEEPAIKKFRRLRRISVVVDDEEIERVDEGITQSKGNDDDDDSADEDWGQNAEKEAVEGDLSEDMDLEDEDDSGKTSERSRKRKRCGGVGKPVFNSIKKGKNVGDTKQSAGKVPSVVNERKSTKPAIQTVDSK